jgi:aspartate carbamoyltransferase catalytic subunit
MHPRSLLSIADLSDAQVDSLLDTADGFIERLSAGSFKDGTLKGTSTLLLFYEPSTRTRVSFELAGKLLGSDTINVSASGSSAEKGESLRDTAMTLGALRFSCLVMRHSSASALRVFAESFPGPVLNAGAGRGQHPTQALLDALTLRQAGVFAPGKHLAIVGDIANSRVMRSALELLARRGVRVTLVGPASMLPEGWVVGAKPASTESKSLQAAGAGEASFAPTVSTDLDAILPSVDALMMLRMQRERMTGGELTTLDEYSKLYGLNRRRLQLLHDDAVILHPGPVNRGVELSEDVFADPRCRINDQVTAGLAVRCALLQWALEREPQSASS